MYSDDIVSMSMQAVHNDILSLEIKTTKQGSYIRGLEKATVSNADSITDAITNLQHINIRADDQRKKRDEITLNSGLIQFNRKVFDELILRKMFVVPSFEIYGGVKGLFDLGPPACALKVAVIDIWRKHFVLAESMLEMECTCLTPELILKTSGHMDRFTDLMVKDMGSGECFRADKILEHAIDDLFECLPDMPTKEKEDHLLVQRQADAFSPSEIDELLLRYDCKGPSGKSYSSSFPFNLMFKTNIGPEGTSVGFLRPETAQGLFVNFRRLLDANANKMPFAAAQIGLGFRNEIAPRAGLLRVREFCMGEIEHFVNPIDKSHPNFHAVADKEFVLFGRDDQVGSGKPKKMSVGEAVQQGLVNNQTLAYFMARTQLFMERIGMNKKCLRFRQHLRTEMAHYACDCWDLEIQSSYGWVECVGHADRACYDLDVHSKAASTPMVATLMLDKPINMEIAKIKFDRKVMGMTFKCDQRLVSGALEALAENWTDFEPVAATLEKEGKVIIGGNEVTKDMLTWSKETKKVHEIKFTPSVIEPSFGIGRILYSLLEHSFYQRDEDEQRCVMRFNPEIAPFKCAVLPISAGIEKNMVVDEIVADLLEHDLPIRVDKSTASLGRRYARADEIGVPFAVTVDFITLADGTVTLRERDSTMQVRLPKKDVSRIIFEFVHGKMKWKDTVNKYPVVLADGGTTEGFASISSANTKTVIESSIRGSFSRPANNILGTIMGKYSSK